MIAIRFPNWIGDCVMALPALRALHRCQPDSEIYVVAKEYLQGFFQNIKEIEDILYIPNKFNLSGLIKSAARLRGYSFSSGILFTNSFASALLFRLGGVGNLLGYKKDGRSFLLKQKPEFPKNDKHHINFYLDLLREFCGAGMAYEESNQLIVTAGEQKKIREQLGHLGVDMEKDWIGMAPSAAYGSAKEWIPGNYRETVIGLMDVLPACQILLFGSQKEAQKIDAICQGMNDRAHNLAGKLSLRQSIEAISLCRVFISNDSGLMHVAAGLRIPQVAIFGPTEPHKTAPIASRARIIHHPVSCAPCKYRQCPRGHECMESVTVSEVMEAVESLWRESPARGNGTNGGGRIG